jgi:hypothetical protein
MAVNVALLELLRASRAFWMVSPQVFKHFWKGKYATLRIFFYYLPYIDRFVQSTVAKQRMEVDISRFCVRKVCTIAYQRGQSRGDRERKMEWRNGFVLFISKKSGWKLKGKFSSSHRQLRFAQVTLSLIQSFVFRGFRGLLWNNICTECAGQEVSRVQKKKRRLCRISSAFTWS